jgi:hypothetical protein
LLATPSLSKASECAQNPLYCDIIKLKPSVDRSFAMELSWHLAKYSRKFGTDPVISVAIAMQESSLSNQDRYGAVFNGGKVTHGISDVGIFQLHVKTIDDLKARGWNIDFERLRTDIKYQTYWHTRLLSRKIQVCRSKRAELKVTPGTEWSCYHSYTQSHRETYLRSVQAHLAKLGR